MKPIIILGMTGAGKTHLLGKFEEYAKLHDIPYAKREECLYLENCQTPQIPSFEEIIQRKPPEMPYLLLIDEFKTLLLKYHQVWEETLKPAFTQGEKFGIVPIVAIQRPDLLTPEIEEVIFKASTTIALMMVDSMIEGLPFSEEIKQRILELRNWDALIIHSSGVLIRAKNREIIPSLLFEAEFMKIKGAKFRKETSE